MKHDSQHERDRYGDDPHWTDPDIWRSLQSKEEKRFRWLIAGAIALLLLLIWGASEVFGQSVGQGCLYESHAREVARVQVEYGFNVAHQLFEEFEDCGRLPYGNLKPIASYEVPEGYTLVLNEAHFGGETYYIFTEAREMTCTSCG